MEISRTFGDSRARSVVVLLVAAANIALRGLLSESHVLRSVEVLNATSLGQRTSERNRPTINQISAHGLLKSLDFEKARENQAFQRHKRKLRTHRLMDVKVNRGFSDYRGQENAIVKVEDPFKVLEFGIGQEETFESHEEMADEERATEDASWFAPQAKLTLNPVYGHYEEKELVEMADEHEREIEENAFCQFPMPEVICIKSINTDITTDYYPRCTVVFRCRPRSGCCENGYVCRVKNSSSILRAFRDMSHVDDFSQPKIHLLRFTNHTECSCKPITDHQDDCLNCPESFERRRRESGQCECYCDRESRNYKLCSSKTQGLRKLTETDLKCIQHNNCFKPPCAHGSFNLTTGFCPCLNHDSLQRKKCEMRQLYDFLNDLTRSINSSDRKWLKISDDSV